MSNQPVERVVDPAAPGVSISIWANKGKFGPFYTTTLQYRKKDKESGEWKTLSSLPSSIAYAVGAMYQQAAQKVAALSKDDKSQVTDSTSEAPASAAKADDDDIPF